ncbi:MAG: tol-pal system protein YbgF [Rhizobiaceae bacterium]
MRFKTILAASLIFTGSTAAVLGGNADTSLSLPPLDVAASQGNFIPLPQVDVQQDQPVLLAQASTQQLEEQIRLLNGKVEEMNFLVLQLQEQMRKMQEDNEFRFQELENSKQGSAKAADSGNDVAAAPEPAATEPAATEPAAPDVAAAPDAPADGAQAGAPPKPLGSIKFDDNGNPIAATVDEVIENTEVAAIPAQGNAEEVYRVAYDHVLAGEYADAESGFRTHIDQFPKDKQTSDARYWLGESLAGQGKHREAAEILLDAQRDFPKAKKAPDMLLKLGVSLAALDNKDVACATFAQVAKKYPKAGPTLLSRVTEEQAKAGC